MTVDDAIQDAAKNLPDDYQVVIEIEKHGYTVSLFRGNMSINGNVDGGDGLISDILQSTIAAIEQEKKE